MQSERLLTVEQVSEILQVPPTWIYKHTKRRAPNRLPHVKLGKYVRFRESEIISFIERSRRV